MLQNIPYYHVVISWKCSLDAINKCSLILALSILIKYTAIDFQILIDDQIKPKNCIGQRTCSINPVPYLGSSYKPTFSSNLIQKSIYNIPSQTILLSQSFIIPFHHQIWRRDQTKYIVQRFMSNQALWAHPTYRDSIILELQHVLCEPNSLYWLVL